MLLSVVQLGYMTISAGRMIKTEAAEVANKTKRKRRRSAGHDDDTIQTSAKAAKIVKEKKLKATEAHKSADTVKSGDLKMCPSDKKLKPSQKITRTDGNQKKPETVRNNLRILQYILIYYRIIQLVQKKK